MQVAGGIPGRRDRRGGDFKDGIGNTGGGMRAGLA
jgi:hypothetical protein